jgi:tRNA 2-thiouridine synthesizing protein A
MTNLLFAEQGEIKPDHHLDVCGLACPLPLLKARKALRDVMVGETLEVLATDPGSWRDFAVFAEQSGQRLLQASEAQGVFRYLLKRNT